MKEFQIEDTIIAYMDGRLTDSESAELLHRVSVSPEIRDIFEKHVTLRNISYRAARNVSVPPELEEDLFAHIESLQEAERDAVPVGFWSTRRLSMTAAAIAILLVAFIGGMEYHTNNAGDIKQLHVAPVAASVNPASANSVATTTMSVPSIQNIVTSGVAPHRSWVVRNSVPRIAAPVTPVAAQNAEQNSTASTIQLVPRAKEVGRVELPRTGSTLASLRSQQDIALNDGNSKFELSIATPITSGFSRPSNVPQLNPFATVSLRAAYNLDSKNQVGLRFTEGSFQGLQQTSGAGFTEVSLGSQSGLSGEILYRHREPVEGLFFVTAGAGYGIYSLGMLITGEVGFEVPFGDHLLGGFSMVLTNLHQRDIQTSDAAIIYDNGPIYKTLDGRIEYGLTYKF